MTSPPHGVSAARIEAALHAALAPSAVEVQDDSHLHAGHAGAREGKHFSVRVVSERFAAARSTPSLTARSARIRPHSTNARTDGTSTRWRRSKGAKIPSWSASTCCRRRVLPAKRALGQW